MDLLLFQALCQALFPASWYVSVTNNPSGGVAPLLLVSTTIWRMSPATSAVVEIDGVEVEVRLTGVLSAVLCVILKALLSTVANAPPAVLFCSSISTVDGSAPAVKIDASNAINVPTFP